ncbi:protein takeout-like [Frankliniella occidentalis]|uniref:Protein takeout-like n=1 Tax=Frankliniella occidentalis TaxID=133901 RepID=A0A9C6WZS1_FRAOC|nr:protein takeout-like [Frankliniella occidentalis]
MPVPARLCLVIAVIVALLIAVVTRTSAAAVKAGDLFDLCKRNDPQLNECVKDSITKLRATFKKGIPELRVPSLDPMVVPRISLNQGNGPVSITSSFKDLHIQGFSDVQINSVKVDLPNFRIDVDCYLPWFYTWGDYDIKGQILILPISGNGPSWSNYTDVRGRAVITGHEVVKKNKTYFGMEDMKFDVDVGHATIHMDNLFNGNKALGDTMNQFMSDNWKAVYSELKPVINEAVGTLLRDVAKKIFDKFPLEELFPM